MKMMKSVLSVLVVGVGFLFFTTCKGAQHIVAEVAVQPEVISVKEPAVGGRASVIGPRWTYGIMVKNASEHDVWVSADGAQGYVLIPKNTEKLIKTSIPGPKKVYWRNGGATKDPLHQTVEFGKPDYMVIQKGNRYDMTAMDGYKDMGTWTAVAPVESLNLKPLMSLKEIVDPGFNQVQP